ncbi:MAG: hypothetical protein IJZ62_05120 [Clostridia bacterium]|nr:hypothetical protein [Clostridia bacterium]
MMTMVEYKQNNDLMGAYARYQSAGATWKSRWWAVVEEIYYSCEEWAKRYVIDPIKHIIKRVYKSRKNFLADNMIFDCEVEGCGAYVVQHFDENDNLLWTKCGKADDGKKRLLQHFTQDYKDIAAFGICLKWYPCKNANHALTVENLIRDHFEKKGCELLGNDRFGGLEIITAEDWAAIQRNVDIVEQCF